MKRRWQRRQRIWHPSIGFGTVTRVHNRFNVIFAIDDRTGKEVELNSVSAILLKGTAEYRVKLAEREGGYELKWFVLHQLSIGRDPRDIRKMLKAASA